MKNRIDRSIETIEEIRIIIRNGRGFCFIIS